MNALFIADDLGMNETINEAIFRSHLQGALDGAGLMMGQPATAAAVARARELPRFAIGWHLHLADSVPCTIERWPWGRSPFRGGVAIALSARLRRIARDEIHAQWEAFRATGLPCRFISGHHHLHVHPFVRDTLLELLPPDFAGWIRWGAPRFFSPSAAQRPYAALYHWLQARFHWPFPVSTTLWGVDRLMSMKSHEVAAVLPALGEGLHEFMFHPRGGHADLDTECLLALRPLLCRE